MTQSDPKLLLDKAIYSKSALVRASYHLADKMDISLTEQGAHWVVYLRPTNLIEDAEALFRRTATDFELREKIEMQTRPVRNRLISVALAEASAK